MKRLQRDPIRFDVFDALPRSANKRKSHFAIQQPQVGSWIAPELPWSVPLSNEALLHGLRTESMFEAMTASLGAVEIIKQEDAGRIYVTDTR